MSVDLLDGSIYYLEDSSKKKSNKILIWSKKREKECLAKLCVWEREKKPFNQIQDT